MKSLMEENNVMKLIRNITKYDKFIILALSLLFVGIGIQRQENLVVFKKAVNICLECIGVG